MSVLSRFGACIAGAAVLATVGAASAQQKTNVSIALGSASFATAVPRIADQMGLFAKYNLEPKFVVMDSASATNAALIGKSVDFALSGPGEIVTSQAHGLKVVAVANGYVGIGRTVVLAKSVADKLARRRSRRQRTGSRR